MLCPGSHRLDDSTRGSPGVYRGTRASFSTLPLARAALADEARAFARTTFDPARQVAAYLDLFARLSAGT